VGYSCLPFQIEKNYIVAWYSITSIDNPCIKSKPTGSVWPFEKENDGINGNKEISFGSSKQRDLLLVVKEFKPHFYDLLLTDIYMPNMNGFELCERILELDVNIKVCFMSALVVNIHALREVILVWFYIEFFCLI